MLTKEENELLTRIGPGTPAGELLRRYWHPVSVINELTAESPTKLIRILGEDLVLFRDKSGRIIDRGPLCAPRRVNVLRPS
jgi:5,5'-dehydrodivanillate O-demethylase